MRLITKIAALVILSATTTFATASSTSSGAFYAYNETDKTVTIAVGDFFPTNYTIRPHSDKLIMVSTNNQAIRIKKIS